ncbi:MAG: hypothetical protein HKL80_09285 [Acidimicrobiales bacterium]|nr:hypothetical protein [Acidimicrobiales bacterium]
MDQEDYHFAKYRRIYLMSTYLGSSELNEPDHDTSPSTAIKPSLPELYFATVRAMGTDVKSTIGNLKTYLNQAGYHCEEVHLSELFPKDSLAQKYLPTNQAANEYEKRNSFMNAGDALRTIRNTAAVARLGLRDICARRGLAHDNAQKSNYRGVAWVIRSLMHEAEVDFYRAVLGHQFFVISLFSDEKQRKEKVINGLKTKRGNANDERIERQATDLLLRDRGRLFGYPHPLAQLYSEIMYLSIEKTFHEADLFVDVDRPEKAEKEIERFVKLIFSYPYSTTTIEETALAHAFIAKRQSAAIARQVGAAIVLDGDVVATGRNDIPAANGGQLVLPPAGEPVDIMSAEPIASRQEREDVLRDILRRLLQSGKFQDIAEVHGISGIDQLEADGVDTLIDQTLKLDDARQSRIFDLIEFNPTVHAEMSAITTAARTGRSLRRGHLFTTTFPCHECSRHIIATGITRVVYLEPYAKSRAEALFSSQIKMGDKDHNTHTSTNPTTDDEKILYEPFMGVAPRRQADLFSWVSRESDSESIKNWGLDPEKPLRETIVHVVSHELENHRNEQKYAEQQLAMREPDEASGPQRKGA